MEEASGGARSKTSPVAYAEWRIGSRLFEVVWFGAARRIRNGQQFWFRPGGCSRGRSPLCSTCNSAAPEGEKAIRSGLSLPLPLAPSVANTHDQDEVLSHEQPATSSN